MHVTWRATSCSSPTATSATSTLAAAQHTTVQFTVETRSSGTFPVQHHGDDGGQHPDPEHAAPRAVDVRQRRRDLPHRRRGAVPRAVVGLGHPQAPAPKRTPRRTPTTPTVPARRAPRQHEQVSDADPFEPDLARSMRRRRSRRRRRSGRGVRNRRVALAHPLERGRRGRHRALAPHRVPPRRRARLRARRHRARRHLQLRELDAEHRLRAAARRHPHRDARPAVRRSTSSRDDDDAAERDHHRRRSLALARGHRPRRSCSRRDHRPLHARRRTAPDRADAAGARHRAPAAVHAADVLLRPHRARDRDAERAPPVRRRRVRAGAQQRRRDRGVPRAARASSSEPLSRCTRVLDDDALVLLLGLGTTAGIVGDGARAAARAAPRRASTCGSCPRGATPPSARCCGCRAGRSAT